MPDSGGLLSASPYTAIYGLAADAGGVMTAVGWAGSLRAIAWRGAPVR